MSTKKALIILLAGAALAIGSLAVAKGKPGPKPGNCNKLIFCLDVWDPVTCDNGVTYSNQCYADRACATGCEGGGASY